MLSERLQTKPYAMLSERLQATLHKKMSYVMLSYSWDNIAQVKTLIQCCISGCRKLCSRKKPVSRLFKSFVFGNGSRMSNENLIILEFKYLQNKKWQKQAAKSARVMKSYRTYYFHFTEITDKNLQFSFKNWRFSTFTTFLLHS